MIQSTFFHRDNITGSCIIITISLSFVSGLSHKEHIITSLCSRNLGCMQFICISRSYSRSVWYNMSGKEETNFHIQNYHLMHHQQCMCPTIIGPISTHSVLHRWNSEQFDGTRCPDRWPFSMLFVPRTWLFHPLSYVQANNIVCISLRFEFTALTLRKNKTRYYYI